VARNPLGGWRNKLGFGWAGIVVVVAGKLSPKLRDLRHDAFRLTVANATDAA